MKMRRILGPLAAALVASLWGGCATVEPWQKVMLTDYTARADRDTLNLVMSEHIYFSREGSSGGRGVGGGGCGCN